MHCVCGRGGRERRRRGKRRREEEEEGEAESEEEESKEQEREEEREAGERVEEESRCCFSYKQRRRLPFRFEVAASNLSPMSPLTRIPSLSGAYLADKTPCVLISLLFYSLLIQTPPTLARTPSLSPTTLVLSFSSLCSFWSPNSLSLPIPTSGAVPIQPTSDGAEERAIVQAGPNLALSIDWKAERGK